MGRPGLQRRMTFYLVFLSAVFLSLTTEMTAFLRGARVAGALEGLARPEARFEVESVVTLVVVKTWVMAGILLAALALVFLLFMKKVTGPIQRILEATSKIGAGNLSVQVSVAGADELGRLAQDINGLAANTQELLLLSSQLTAQARAALGRMHTAETEDERTEATGEASASIRDLEQLIADFGHSFFGESRKP